MTIFSKKTLNKIRIFIVKTITLIMGIIFILCLCTDLDYASWSQIWIVMLLMAISGGWLFMMAYFNGWVTGTDYWYERQEREGNDMY